MTTAQFETAAKTAVCEYLEDELGLRFTPDQMHTVWLCHIVGFKKGLFIDPDRKSNRYYEVTWNAAIDEMYLDVYEKKDKVTLDMERVQGILKRCK